jgi:hypothetical protein
MTRKPNRSVVDAGVLLLSDPLLVVLEGEEREGDSDSEGEPVVGDASLFTGNGGGDMEGIPYTCGEGNGERRTGK